VLILPAIDLKAGRCVRLTQGRRSDVTVYDADPVEIARSFEAGGARMLHVVDLDGAFAIGASPNRGVLDRILGAVSIPVQFGGGMRSEEAVRRAVEAGVARVVVGTLAVESPDTLGRLVHAFGARIAVGIDARSGQVVTRGWEKQGAISALDLACRVARAGVERIVYTDVARDGTLEGVNVEQTRAIARESGLRVTASGGVASLADLERLKQAGEPGLDSVIVGKALYEGRFTLEEALRIAAWGGEKPQGPEAALPPPS
jgi:phosphoribosylformimino-5-aminoimidazole carboxamide ribotide isomerase